MDMKQDDQQDDGAGDHSDENIAEQNVKIDDTAGETGITTADNIGDADNPFDVPLDASGMIDFAAMTRQTDAAVKKYEDDLEQLRGKDSKPPPEPTTQERLSQVANVVKDHARSLPLAKFHGWTPMESLNETPGMKSLRKLLMGPVADRKAAFDAILAVQAMEYYALAQSFQSRVVKQFDGDDQSMDKLLARKIRADTHLLKLIELNAKLSAPFPPRKDAE